MREMIRLLLVEDDEHDAALIFRELERGGFDVVWRRVASEVDLRNSLARGPWDIIISDFKMPGFDGLRAFQVVQQLRVETPFIFVSGALGEERAVEAMRAGARDYLLKDNLARLSVAVRREIATAHTRESERQLEADAQKEQRRLGMAVEASGAGIFEHSSIPGAGHYMSPRLLAMLGHDEQTLPVDANSENWVRQLIHPEDRATYEQAYMRLLDGRAERLATEVRVKHQGGHWVDIAIFAKAVDRDDAGLARQVIGVVMDLSERRSLEDQLRQAQKMEAIGQLAGGVAHDFNNILTAIFSFAQFAIETMETESQPYRDLKEVLHAAERAKSLTSQLLAFSRRRPVAPRVVNVNELLQNLQLMLTRVVGEDVTVTTDLQEELENVRIDPGSFEQVIVNLAVNARDAMPDGGTFLLATSNLSLHEESQVSHGERIPPGAYVEIRASDTGFGMNEATTRRAFEPFFTTKGVGSGTGLGLSTCYGIVKQADGFITVESQPGSGTTFRILIPQTRNEVEREAPKQSTKLHSGSETVLVAEDEDQLRRLTVRVLSDLGYQVLHAANGKEALALFRDHAGPIDLLVTDVIMPEVSGKSLAEQLVSERPAIKVLFISGYAPSVIASRGVLEPGTHLLNKPFTPDQLGRTVRKVLDS